MLCNRSDVFEVFKNYKLKTEKQTSKSIKKLRTDNGRKYLSNIFENFLKDEGISYQLSIKYNAAAKRNAKTAHLSRGQGA